MRPAISAGVLMRPSGTGFIATWNAFSRDTPMAAAMPSMPCQAISVSTQPGQMALTATFWLASSSAMARTRPRMPALDAQ